MELERTDLVLLVMGWLGIGLDEFVSDFNVRKTVQKIIYLQQAKGFDLGYKYGLYIQGPYCPALSQEIYESIEHGVSLEELTRKYMPSDSFAEFLGSVRDHSVDTLELLATLAFLWNESSLKWIEDETLRYYECLEWLKDHKPQFSESEIESAFITLETKGFLHV